MNFKKMRVAPTITIPPAGQSSGNITFLTSAGAYPATTGTNVATKISVNNFAIEGSGYAGLTTHGACILYSVGANTIRMDSEL